MRRAFFSLVVALAASAATAAGPGSKFRDASDGWFDLASFIDTAYGFVPIVSPITEPAVGYGAVGALVFIDRKPPVEGQGFVRPNIAVAGGLLTENGTDALFAAHLGTWRQGRLRTEVALADADVNLEFFGLGGSSSAGEASLDYSIKARGGVAGGNYRIGNHPLWMGLRYMQAQTRVSFADPGAGQPEIPLDDRDLRLGALTFSMTLDTRDNFFTPTRGWYLNVSAPIYREALGGERDFETLAVTGMYFRPVRDRLFFGMRATAKASSDGAPFYLRPYVALRGVQVLRYQGEQSAEAEAELRWQFHPRFSAVGFAGAGMARSSLGDRDRTKTVGAGGLGIRYLLARTYGLHMGLDVAVGPDDPVVYVVFGTPWLRP